jgi:hypothetical protein
MTGLFSIFRVRTAKLQIINKGSNARGNLFTLGYSEYLAET